MRSCAVIAILLVVSGCRSPQAAYRAQAGTASMTVPARTAIEISRDDSISSTSSRTIEGLVQIGLSNNPKLTEAKHRVNSLRHRIPQELSLPDPMASTTTHLAPVETAAGRQAFAVGLSQKFVDADRRATKAAIANDEVRAAEAEFMAIEREIAEQVRVACYQLLLVRETIRINNEDVESLAQIEEVVLRQYEVKKSVSQQDVLNVQIEQSKLENQLTQLRQKELSHLARLARLLHFAPSSNIALADTLTTNSMSLDVDQLIAQAQQARPELASQLAKIRRDRRKICLANLQNKPDFTVGLNWIATSSDGISPVANGDDAFLIGVGFNLPVYKNRIRAAVCEAQSASFASSAQLEVIRDEIAEEVFDTVAKLDGTAVTLALLQDDIIPKSERTLELSIEEYSTSKTDFTQLIENWRGVLKYRVALANLQAQQLQLLASLARQIGQLEPLTFNPAFDAIQSPQPEYESGIENADHPEDFENDAKEADERVPDLDKIDAAKSSRNPIRN